jgi:hypothetical protein
MVANACNPSYMGGTGKRIMVQGYPGQKSVRPYLENKLKQKGPEAWLKRYRVCLASAKP